METTEQLAIDAGDHDEQEAAHQNPQASSNGFGWPLTGMFQKASPDKLEVPVKRNPSKLPRKGAAAAASVGITGNRNPPPSEDGFSVDRYQHDVEQAKLMRRGMKKHQQERRKNDVTEYDVRMGLDGLDQADNLRRQGRTREALKVSQLSIELLIHFLRSDPSVLPGVARETVGARVQGALTDAEEMKANISNRSVDDPTPGVSTTANANTASLSQSLSEVLKSFSLTDPASGDDQKRSTRQQPSRRQQPTGQSTSSVPGPAATQRLVTTPSAVAAKRAIHGTTANTAQPARRVASPFANSNDPMVQTIKSELYIDPSQLQSTTWDDIAGLDDAKQALQEAAILPLLRPDLFSGLRKPRNILLYGPPGTGKTLLVKAVAHESQCLLFICTASSLTSKWLGEGEKLLRTLFQVARAAAPSIIFVDEMDALLSSRKSEGEHEASRRFKTEFMTQMDGIVKTDAGGANGKNLVLIAATNCPWDIDSAVLRRFPRRIYVPLPDVTTRKALLLNLLKKAGNTSLTSSDVTAIVKRLSGFSGSDIASIASEVRVCACFVLLCFV